MRPISRYLKHSEELKTLFGSFYNNINTWTDNEIFVSGRTITEKEATISTFGVQSDKVVGKHFDLIICDDIVDLENSRTELQREKIKEWFYQVLMPTLMENGEILIIGTRYNPQDLYQHLINHEYKENHIVFRAINTDETGKEFSLWEDRFPLEKLKQIRQEMGSILFSAQFQNDASLMKGNIFKPEWMQEYTDINWRSPEYELFQAVDLSTGEGTDYTVDITIAVDKKTQNIYVLDYYRGKVTFSVQVEKILDKYKTYKEKITYIGIEAVAYQKVMLQHLNRINAYMPLKAIKTHKDKLSRFHSLSALFEQRKVFVKPWMTELRDELLSAPNGANDDIVDALEMAVSLTGHTKIQPVKVI